MALLFRLSVPSVADSKQGVMPEPTYGDQFNNAAIQGVKSESRVEIRSQTLHHRFADGACCTLQKPIYTRRV